MVYGNIPFPLIMALAAIPSVSLIYKKTTFYSLKLCKIHVLQPKMINILSQNRTPLQVWFITTPLWLSMGLISIVPHHLLYVQATRGFCYWVNPSSMLKKGYQSRHKVWTHFSGVLQCGLDPSYFSSSLCYCTAELLSRHGVRRPLSVVRCPSSAVFVRRSSVDIVFSDTVEWSNSRLWGTVPVHHISRPYFVFVL